MFDRHSSLTLRYGLDSFNKQNIVDFAVVPVVVVVDFFVAVAVLALKYYFSLYQKKMKGIRAFFTALKKCPTFVTSHGGLRHPRMFLFAVLIIFAVLKMHTLNAA